jgi:hypothetical protein
MVVAFCLILHTPDITFLKLTNGIQFNGHTFISLFPAVGEEMYGRNCKIGCSLRKVGLGWVTFIIANNFGDAAASYTFQASSMNSMIVLTLRIYSSR